MKSPKLSIKSLWETDRIQFARLLSEIRGNIDIATYQWDHLCQEMDLTPAQLEQIFERAQMLYERTKKQIFKKLDEKNS